MSQVLSVTKGVHETLTIVMRPPESIDGWTLTFRAKSCPKNPDLTTATILMADCAASEDIVTVQAVEGFPLQGPFKIRVDNEVMQVVTGVGYYTNGIVNKEWTVERAVWGTTAAAHARRARVTLFSTPQMLLDNGDHGGVTVEDADNGVITLTFDADFTSERPVGTYYWGLFRTTTGAERLIADGTLYLLPSAVSAFTEPPLHNG